MKITIMTKNKKEFEAFLKTFELQSVIKYKHMLSKMSSPKDEKYSVFEWDADAKENNQDFLYNLVLQSKALDDAVKIFHDFSETKKVAKK